MAWHQCQGGTKNDKLSVHALGLDKRDVIGLDIKNGHSDNFSPSSLMLAFYMRYHS